MYQLLVYYFTLTVVTSDPHVAQLVDDQSNVTHNLSFPVVPNVESTFFVDARHVGITRLILRVYSDDDVILATVDYTVRVLRKSRAVDRLFELGILGQALFNAFALGCGADWQRIKRHLAGNVADFLTPFIQQLVLLPAVRKPTRHIVKTCQKYLLTPTAVAIVRRSSTSVSLYVILFVCLFFVQRMIPKC